MPATYEAAVVGWRGNITPSLFNPMGEPELNRWLFRGFSAIRRGAYAALEVRDLSTGQLTRIKPRSRA